MGFYLRKSISVGGLRFNSSKSGVGVSAGFKGLRIGTGPKGNYIHAGRNGFYYRKTIGDTNKPLPQIQNENTDAPLTYNFKDIESGCVSFMTDSSFDDILNEINSKSSKVRLWIFGLIASIFILFINESAAGVLFLCIPALYYLDKRRKRTYLIYDIEEEFEKKLQNFYDKFDSLKNSRKAWHVQSEARLTYGHEQKINAGASNLVKRSKITIKTGLPKNIVSNVRVLTIPVGKQTLYFFPERLLIEEKGKFGTINYHDLKIEHTNVRFIESDPVPSDAEIVDHTWLYVNKNGGPDRRFKSNRQLPIVKYSEINRPLKNTPG